MIRFDGRGLIWCCTLVLCLLHSATTQADNYRAREESLRSFFVALSEPLGKPIIVSKAAAGKRISGDFAMTSAQQVFDRVVRQMGLIWYSDGQAIYLYDSAELKSAMVSLHNTSVDTLRAFLRRSGLLDPRYPLRGDGRRTFYVSGPPIYVDLVQRSAAMVDQEPSQILLGRQQVGVIHLLNTFVGDRRYELREQTVNIAGIASVIESLLQGEKARVDLRDSLGQEQPNSALMLSALDDNLIEQAWEGQRLAPEQMAAANIRVVAYPDTNSLLVKGLPEQVRFIENLVEALDTPKRHVELSLWIIDLQKEALEQLGVDWQGQVNIGSQFSISLNGGSSTTLDGLSFIARVSALARSDLANVVARPVILTQENVPAIFDNNRTFYAPLLGERSVDLQHVTYGTLVSVLPRFARGDEIEMSLNIEDGNEVEPRSAEQPTVLPTVGRTRISTVARVPQGKSLLVGGFSRDESAEQVSRVPVLGALPWIGRVFSYRQQRSANTVRVFLIQPREIGDALAFDPQSLKQELFEADQHERLRQAFMRAVSL
ncbi:type III secretion system outer membrane ring subunit SctC [Pseudomonas rubra]|uniref:Type 3 secretion system secretin n=1 Tax=Pseudomonas rubra TaxID=2942627 RepID=A0ABT5PCJ2_9PSED|nr:type III secretion system outer membrane ring subunit SctC [Pseudomonas rubra]MDD1016017.1 type III secretion system outer membrane ring subunit SctC [Pseudomonas rubra]MDD1039212.1 type III secretion system outer membrane ring subunit SctC [Pseudomonas rubra]MDD1155182.1 type III secretion system outer membrane ring subunit SctC [Pseudomonas rubra]